MQDLSGTTIGQYELHSLLGKGGMAMVYRAYQPSMERPVAIKVLSPGLASDAEFIARFEREARIIAQLQHPHILPVFDFGRAGPYTFLVMRLIEGGTLGDELHGRPLPLARVSLLTGQIADALDYAHRHGIVHRDLKPTNVLLEGRDRVFLTDFGIAKLIVGGVFTGLTAPNAVMGTPTYMAPEQWRSEPVDARTDVYALGVMVYQMLAGKVPFAAETPHGLMYQHLDQQPTPVRQFNPALPPDVELVLRRALAKDRRARYASAGALARDLDRALSFPARLPEQTVFDAPPELLDAPLDADLADALAEEDLLAHADDADQPDMALTNRAVRPPLPPAETMPPARRAAPFGHRSPAANPPPAYAAPPYQARPSTPSITGYAPPYRAPEPVAVEPPGGGFGRLLTIAVVLIAALIVMAGIVLISALLLDSGPGAPAATATTAAPVARPLLTITAPADGAMLQLGSLVAVQFTASAQGGITRIELRRFGQVLNTIEGSGEKTFQGWFTYSVNSTGTHELTVTAYSGTQASEPARVTLFVQ
ncbi:MAG: protein kinase [Anaerolineae bacterium]|nr:protein kinase [Anaerolineae bacterium]